VSAVADLGLDVPVNIYLVVADFARPVNQISFIGPVYPRSFIVGNLSVRTSDYPEFMIENTLPGMDLVLKELSTETEVTMESGILGFFQFEMMSGSLQLEVQDRTTGNILYQENISSQNKNYFLDIFIDM